jgi:hypothetical protein
MANRYAIDLALDLTRMPALARTSVTPPIPPDVVELMRIAALCPQSCQAAVAKTGESTQVLVEAARFYLQQVLFRPDADCYRILGIEPSASRATARSHMRWLLKWLHPDHNGTWDAVYAERVLKAWREVSTSATSAEPLVQTRKHATTDNINRRQHASIRLPWIEHPVKKRRAGLWHPQRVAAMWAIPTAAAIIFLMLWSIFYYFGAGQMVALTPFQ